MKKLSVYIDKTRGKNRHSPDINQAEKGINKDDSKIKCVRWAKMVVRLATNTIIFIAYYRFSVPFEPPQKSRGPFSRECKQVQCTVHTNNNNRC